jgi:hypothetical protein
MAAAGSITAALTLPFALGHLQGGCCCGSWSGSLGPCLWVAMETSVGCRSAKSARPRPARSASPRGAVTDWELSPACPPPSDPHLAWLWRVKTTREGGLRERRRRRRACGKRAAEESRRDWRRGHREEESKGREGVARKGTEVRRVRGVVGVLGWG